MVLMVMYKLIIVLTAVHEVTEAPMVLSELIGTKVRSVGLVRSNICTVGHALLVVGRPVITDLG